MGIFNVQIKENKVGRKVESIDFIVQDLDKRKYFDKDILELDNKNFNVLNNEKEEFENISIEVGAYKKEFYVPNKKLFTTKTLSLFEVDFKNYDFNDNNIKNKFYEAIGTTLEKDDVEKIYMKSYNYFKKVLTSKLDEIQNKNEKYTQTKFHNFDETFTKYSEEEFENIILESQKKKFG